MFCDAGANANYQHLKKKDFTYLLFIERGRGGRGGEKHLCGRDAFIGGLSHAPAGEPGPQPGPVP